jgi:hypothetical protein
MKALVIVVIVVAALAAAIHLGGGRFAHALRGLHGGGAGLHGSR